MQGTAPTQPARRAGEVRQYPERQRGGFMKRTKAARIYKYGGPEVVQVEETPLPDPQLGEVVVRVHAAGVNPIDWKIRSGYMKQVMPLTLPFTLGGDFSGVVE